jgi:oligopeptide/dipeptide ABC transporter ATP-binding protein
MLAPPTEGQVIFDGQDISSLARGHLKSARDKMKMIFQDQSNSLDPRMTVRNIVAEPLSARGIYKSRSALDNRVAEVLEIVGLDCAYMGRYPHEFSGGQRQRIGIARAIALEPRFIVCDEPVSALDVSIQAKIVNLLKALQKRLGMAYLFISHDLGVVKHVSDRIMVMYLGKIMEIAPKAELYKNPAHPYTKLLFSSIPSMESGSGSNGKGSENSNATSGSSGTGSNGGNYVGSGGIGDGGGNSIGGSAPGAAKMGRAARETAIGEIPGPAGPPSGCRFRTRCPIAESVCSEKMPELGKIGPNHFCACHFAARDFEDGGIHEIA